MLDRFCTILILTPMKRELIAILKSLQRAGFSTVRQSNHYRIRSPGASRPKTVLATTCGIGPEEACIRLAHLLQQHQPSAVVLAGLAAGLNPQIQTGECFTIDRVLAEGQPVIDLPTWPWFAAAKTAPARHTAELRSSLVSVTRAITRPADKHSLHQMTGYNLLDMETYSVAQLSRERGLPLFACRAVCDSAKMKLPDGMEQWLTVDGGIRPLRFARWLLLHPSAATSLPGLAKASKIALRALGTSVARSLDGLLDLSHAPAAEVP